MRAWLMDSMEGVGALRLGEVADPRPGSAQVLLRVKIAALNPADAFLAQGMYPATPPLPHILGRVLARRGWQVSAGKVPGVFSEHGHSAVLTSRHQQAVEWVKAGPHVYINQRG
jgi:hypothetical protein